MKKYCNLCKIRFEKSWSGLILHLSGPEHRRKEGQVVESNAYQCECGYTNTDAEQFIWHSILELDSELAAVSGRKSVAKRVLDGEDVHVPKTGKKPIVDQVLDELW